MAKGTFPARARQSVAYEVRIYSIAGSSCGEVIWAKRIRAAHCLTSLQFSPTSEHILLAYGRHVLSLVTLLCMEFSSISIPTATGQSGHLAWLAPSDMQSLVFFLGHLSARLCHVGSLVPC